MRRKIVPLLAVLAVLAAPGCGAEENSPKRALDPLDEALRFFPAGAEAVVLVRADREGFATLGRLARQIAPVQTPVADVSISMRALGGRDAVAELAQPSESSAARVALGSETVGRLLGAGVTVLVTDRGDELAGLVDDAMERGRVLPAGTFHEARLFRSPGGALAERDGVLLTGPSPSALREAIAIRDGDSDEHLDDREAEDAIDELSPSAPLVAYLDMDAFDADDDIPRKLRRADWLDRLDHAAIAAQEAGGGVVVQVFGDADGAELETTVDLAALNRLPSPIEPAGPVSVDGDELRVALRLGP
jgi:hypothetical protein